MNGCSWFLFSLVLLIFIPSFILRWIFRRKRRSGNLSIAFFHPYCNAGGGGERVLWCAIREIQKHNEKVRCVVYTGDRVASPEDILEKAKDRFDISFPRPVKFVFLRHRWLIATTYPCFTLLCQSLGGMLLAFEALCRFSPDVFIDSMGYAFSLPVFRFLAGSRVCCYVHYPTISTDMLDMVSSRQSAYNNRSAISRWLLLTWAKQVYYRLFAKLYGWVGRASQVNMVNSRWTYGHIVQLWKRPERTLIVYPPCDVTSFEKIKVNSEELEEIRILSVGQFRPEKNHRLQLESLQKLKNIVARQGSVSKPIKLVLAGSCRHEEDRRRVGKLKKYAQELKLDESVEWKLNISYCDLMKEFSTALIGLHTMWNEHFGIGIVEGMAAGNIMIAHNSGGPKLDILQRWEGEVVGFLAETPEEYADQMLEVIRMDPGHREKIRISARKAVERFSEENFNKLFIEGISSLL